MSVQCSQSDLKVMTPERSDLILATNVPQSEVYVLAFDIFNVEANRGNRRDNLAELQLVEDGGLTGRVQTWERGKLCENCSEGRARDGSTHQPSGSSCPSSRKAA